ncbi:DUF1203 domain-containing protein [Sulfitobacter sp. S190]|uniref:DUF1203 domain-containing protein n=1 Tax=Sulfitobacter sp. S190 TaxID=2867022 RepID=UPI0021A34509|nr:DUF1203 domain-containing protein [Sulfitobacter sp. S190]UWR21093.1 DUF1203 domain-containing protein [Sulfitobacter sp. S190]
MSFRIRGLDPAPFAPLFGQSDSQLAARNIHRSRVDSSPGVPDRITMTDLEVGDSVLLLNHTHQPHASPYRAAHAIYIKEGAQDAYDRTDHIPEVLQQRTLSLRGFDTDGMIADAALVDGADCADAIETLLADPQVAYIHAHFAARGCYAGLITRA